MPVKPMLAAAAPTELAGLPYPLLASPKLDGVRATVQGGVVLSRSLKPLPNRFVQARYGRPEFEGLDGELSCGRQPVSRSMSVGSMAQRRSWPGRSATKRISPAC